MIIKMSQISFCYFPLNICTLSCYYAILNHPKLIDVCQGFPILERVYMFDFVSLVIFKIE